MKLLNSLYNFILIFLFYTLIVFYGSDISVIYISGFLFNSFMVSFDSNSYNKSIDLIGIELFWIDKSKVIGNTESYPRRLLFLLVSRFFSSNEFLKII